MKIHRWLGERGATAVEFALVAPMFIFLILGILELGYLVFIQSILDWGTRDAARMLRTGQAQSTANALQAFTNQLCGDISPMIACGNVVIQAQVFANWSTASSTTNQAPQRDKHGNLVSAGFTAGTGQQIVVVQVAYNYSYLTAWLGGQTAFLMSTVAFRNEPFPSG
jgi:Flp pilus assembly protein TadG